LSESRKHWWTASSRHARRGAIGGIALFSSLAVIGAVVWSSPAGPAALVSGAVDRAAAAVDPATTRLRTENAELAAKVKGLRTEVSTRDAALKAAYSGRSPLQANAASSTPGSTAVTAPADAPANTVPIVLRSRTGDTGSGSRGPVPTSTAAPAPAVKPTPTPAPTLTPGPAPVPTVTVTTAPKPAASSTPKPTTAPQPAPAPTPTKQPAPLLAALTAPTGRYFGLYTEQAPFSWSTYDDASTKLATTPETVGYFSGWDEAFRANAVTRAWARNTLPILTWESRPIAAANNVVDEPDYTLSRIIDGGFDDYLRTYAKSVVATGLPLGIRLDHEMNGTWYPWSEDDGHGNSINGNSPGQYVQMWRHVHDIFQQEGANQYVFWIWSPNRINKLTSSHRTEAYLASLYPGDAYVDWVGMSGYLRPAYSADDDFTFDYTFGSTLTQLRAIAPGKRILLAEIGASETGGHKVAWIQSMFDAFARPENADIVGLLWFDEAVSTYTEGVLGTNDWRVDSRPETLAAFKAGLARTDNGFVPLPSP
jgi:beta-mannanase